VNVRLALTVRQPYAWAIVFGSKNPENRPRPVPPQVIGQRIGIHAGKKWHPNGDTDPRILLTAIAAKAAGRLDSALAVVEGDPSVCTIGAVIGTAILTGSHPDTGSCCAWGDRSYTTRGRRVTVHHWDLTSVWPLREPVPHRGQVVPILWTLSDAAQAAIAAQTEEAALP
jgi:hypothetical protein